MSNPTRGNSPPPSPQGGPMPRWLDPNTDLRIGTRTLYERSLRWLQTHYDGPWTMERIQEFLNHRYATGGLSTLRFRTLQSVLNRHVRPRPSQAPGNSGVGIRMPRRRGRGGKKSSSAATGGTEDGLSRWMSRDLTTSPAFLFAYEKGAGDAP